MNLDELKQEIADKTGLPIVLLNGETAEENIAQAKALLAYKREQAAKQPQSARDQFKAWTMQQFNEEPQDTAGAALEGIEEALRVEAGGYPRVEDGGDTVQLGDTRPAREQFKEWVSDRTAFNPFKHDGWTRLNE